MWTRRPSAAARARISRQAGATLEMCGQLQATPLQGAFEETTGEVGGGPPGGEYISGPGPAEHVSGPWRKAREKARWAERPERVRDGSGLWGALSAPARPAYTGRSRRGPVSHETHLSAKKAQASADARFPHADADARRPADAEAPSRQGPQAADGLMRAHAPGAAAARARTAVAQCRLRPRLSPRPFARRPRVRPLRLPAGRGGDPPRLGLSVRARSAAQSSATASSGSCARPSRSRAQRLPAGTDAVVVARHDARALAEREGLAGVQRALGELLDRVVGRRGRCSERAGRGRREAGGDERGVGPESSLDRRREPARPRCRRAHPGLSAAVSPGFGTRCKYYPSCSEYAAQAISAIRHTPRARPGRLAAASLQPLEPRRVRSRRGSAAVQVPSSAAERLTMLVTANIFQPLIDVFEAVLKFFHNTIGRALGLVDRAAHGRDPRGPAPADPQAVPLDAELQQRAARAQGAPGASTRTTSSASSRS